MENRKSAFARTDRSDMSGEAVIVLTSREGESVVAKRDVVCDAIIEDLPVNVGTPSNYPNEFPTVWRN